MTIAHATAGVIAHPVARPTVSPDQPSSGGLVFHSLAGSDLDWTSPVVGTPATKYGIPIYLGGGTIGVASAGWLKKPIAFFPNNNEGTIVVTITPSIDFDTTNNWILYFRSGNVGDAEMQIRFLGSDFNVSFSATDVTDYFNSSVTSSTYFTIGVQAVIRFHWNISGIGGGGNTFEVYIDDVLVMSSTDPFSNANWSVADIDSTFLNNADIINNYFRGSIDDIKVHDIDNGA